MPDIDAGGHSGASGAAPTAPPRLSVSLETEALLGIGVDERAKEFG
jgi:hypothetical protein